MKILTVLFCFQLDELGIFHLKSRYTLLIARELSCPDSDPLLLTTIPFISMWERPISQRMVEC